jgi:hypothetical protein
MMQSKGNHAKVFGEKENVKRWRENKIPAVGVMCEGQRGNC